MTALEERVGDLGAADLYAPLGQVSGSYQYDGNGNMTHDSRRGLQLSYNSLHLLSSVRDAGGGVRAVYGYSSDGVKRSVRGADGSGYEYRGSMIYRRSGSSLILESAGFSGGRIHAAGSGYEVCYFLTDHLGNVRVVLDGEGNVRERNDYYPFGTRHRRGDYPSLAENRFKFGGKEEQNTGDLGYLDFIARPYDPLLGKWFMMDPLGEEYYPVSPYAYCMNNPLVYTDPTGMYLTHYMDEEYNTLLQTDDGSDNVVMVGKKSRGLFMGNVELSSQERLDSKGWNSFWTEELGLADRQFNASELAVMDLYSSEESRNAAAAYFLNPTVGNMAKSAFSEAGSQWMDPEKLVMGASIGVGGLSALGGMGSAAKGGIAPKGWISQVSKKGGGTIFKDPNNSHNSIRQMPGNPNSPNIAQRNPYVVFKKNGVAYDMYGNPLKSATDPAAHIPLNQFNINKMPKF